MGSKDTQFKAKNQAALRHGGAGALRRVSQGEDFIGVAREAEQGVIADLETRGRAYLVQEQATRLHTCARLYWDAIQATAGTDDLAALTRYVKQFTYVAQAALRAWREVRQEVPHDANVLDYEEILARQGEDSGDD
jgi:hypothetical protein